MAVVKLAAAGKSSRESDRPERSVARGWWSGSASRMHSKRSLSSTFGQDVRKETISLRGKPLKQTEWKLTRDNQKRFKFRLASDELNHSRIEVSLGNRQTDAPKLVDILQWSLIARSSFTGSGLRHPLTKATCRNLQDIWYQATAISLVTPFPWTKAATFPILTEFFDLKLLGIHLLSYFWKHRLFAEISSHTILLLIYIIS